MDRGRAAAALLALAACLVCSNAAPTANDQTSLEVSDGPSNGCYYNFQHYGEGDRIMTNEPCLNCTCHNRMLMCYLRVCPFTKAIGQDCTVEKRADQCCPIVTCPDVPVDLLTSTSTSSPAEYGATGLGKLDKYGCSINGKYFPEGSKVPPSPNKPCEHCYCIRNMTTCVMQECTLHVDGCTPIYHKDVCCPVRYSCDHPEDEIPLLDDMTTTVRPTPGFLLTTTTMLPVTQATQDCIHDDEVFPDGALIKTEKACEHCYCMKGDIVCVVQECGTPMENEGKNCTSLPPRHGQCCPDTYICEGDELSTEMSTETQEPTTVPPRRIGVEGSGYRNEPDTYTHVTSVDIEEEGSGEDHLLTTPIVEPESVKETLETSTEIKSMYESSTEIDKGLNTVPDVPYKEDFEDVKVVQSTTVPNLSSDSDDITTPISNLDLVTIAEHHTSPSLHEVPSIEDDTTTPEILPFTKEDTTSEINKSTAEHILDEVTTKPDDFVTDKVKQEEDKVTTEVPKEINQDRQTTTLPQDSTVTYLDKSQPTETFKPEKETETSIDDLNSEFFTTAKEKLDSTETTSVNPIENEINESPIYSPGRIPGEGDCLLNSITYENNSIVPSTNNCHTGCRCISSIIKCDPIICSSPPEYMKDCQPIYDSPESCCPTYICNTKETIPPESHNQMSDIDSTKPVSASECDTPDCTSHEKTEQQINTDCSDGKCPNNEQLCTSESGCQDTQATPCKGNNCQIDATYEKEPNQSPTCHGEYGCTPSEANVQVECKDGDCKKGPDTECYGSECEKVSHSQSTDIEPSHEEPAQETTVPDIKHTSPIPEYSTESDHKDKFGQEISTSTKSSEMYPTVTEKESTDTSKYETSYTEKIPLEDIVTSKDVITETEAEQPLPQTEKTDSVEAHVSSVTDQGYSITEKPFETPKDVYPSITGNDFILTTETPRETTVKEIEEPVTSVETDTKPGIVEEEEKTQPQVVIDLADTTTSKMDYSMTQNNLGDSATKETETTEKIEDEIFTSPHSITTETPDTATTSLKQDVVTDGEQVNTEKLEVTTLQPPLTKQHETTPLNDIVSQHESSTLPATELTIIMTDSTTKSAQSEEHADNSEITRKPESEVPTDFIANTDKPVATTDIEDTSETLVYTKLPITEQTQDQVGTKVSETTEKEGNAEPEQAEIDTKKPQEIYSDTMDSVTEYNPVEEPKTQDVTQSPEIEKHTTAIPLMTSTIIDERNIEETQTDINEQQETEKETPVTDKKLFTNEHTTELVIQSSTEPNVITNDKADTTINSTPELTTTEPRFVTTEQALLHTPTENILTEKPVPSVNEKEEPVQITTDTSVSNLITTEKDLSSQKATEYPPTVMSDLSVTNEQEVATYPTVGNDITQTPEDKFVKDHEDTSPGIVNIPTQESFTTEKEYPKETTEKSVISDDKDHKETTTSYDIVDIPVQVGFTTEKEYSKETTEKSEVTDVKDHKETSTSHDIPVQESFTTEKEYPKETTDKSEITSVKDLEETSTSSDINNIPSQESFTTEKEYPKETTEKSEVIDVKDHEETSTSHDIAAQESLTTEKEYPKETTETSADIKDNVETSSSHEIVNIPSQDSFTTEKEYPKETTEKSEITNIKDHEETSTLHDIVNIPSQESFTTEKEYPKETTEKSEITDIEDHEETSTSRDIASIPSQDSLTTEKEYPKGTTEKSEITGVKDLEETSTSQSIPDQESFTTEKEYPKEPTEKLETIDVKDQEETSTSHDIPAQESFTTEKEYPKETTEKLEITGVKDLEETSTSQGIPAQESFTTEKEYPKEATEKLETIDVKDQEDTSTSHDIPAQESFTTEKEYPKETIEKSEVNDVNTSSDLSDNKESTVTPLYTPVELPVTEESKAPHDHFIETDEQKNVPDNQYPTTVLPNYTEKLDDIPLSSDIPTNNIETTTNIIKENEVQPETELPETTVHLEVLPIGHSETKEPSKADIEEPSEDSHTSKTTLKYDNVDSTESVTNVYNALDTNEVNTRKPESYNTEIATDRIDISTKLSLIESNDEVTTQNVNEVEVNIPQDMITEEPILNEQKTSDDKSTSELPYLSTIMSHESDNSIPNLEQEKETMSPEIHSTQSSSYTPEITTLESIIKETTDANIAMQDKKEHNIATETPLDYHTLSAITVTETATSAKDETIGNKDLLQTTEATEEKLETPTESTNINHSEDQFYNPETTAPPVSDVTSSDLSKSPEEITASDNYRRTTAILFDATTQKSDMPLPVTGEEIKTYSPIIDENIQTTSHPDITEDLSVIGHTQQDTEVAPEKGATDLPHILEDSENKDEKLPELSTKSPMEQETTITGISSEDGSSPDISMSLVTDRVESDNKQTERVEIPLPSTPSLQPSEQEKPLETTEPSSVTPIEQSEVSSDKFVTDKSEITPETPIEPTEQKESDKAPTTGGKIDTFESTESVKHPEYVTENPTEITTLRKIEYDESTKSEIDETSKSTVTEKDLVPEKPEPTVDDQSTESLPSKDFDEVTTSVLVETEPEKEMGSSMGEPESTSKTSSLDNESSTISYKLPETADETKITTEPVFKYSETTPYLIELEEHTHESTDQYSSKTPLIEGEPTTERNINEQPERGDLPDTPIKYDEDNTLSTNPVEETHVTVSKDDVPVTIPTDVKPGQESSPQYGVTTTESETIITQSPTNIPKEHESPITQSEAEKGTSPILETESYTEKHIDDLDKEQKPEVATDSIVPVEDNISSTPSATTIKSDDVSTHLEDLDKFSKPEVKPSAIPETTDSSKPELNEPPSDEIPSPDFSPSGPGGYGQEPDYSDSDDQAFGPGTCRYGGKVYVSAQQIPRDDPCDFCFCFRSDIICLQQSCPPPIHGCHEEPIQGFCCPRYECPVSMATTLNVTTTTTTTTTTLPPHFLAHAYKGAAQRRGCQIKGHTYKVGEVVRASSGPCLHCTCGGDGQMKCDPKACTPEPMLRQMIAAAVSAKRRR